MPKPLARKTSKKKSARRSAAPRDALSISRVHLDFPLAANPDRVWNALVVETARWWPKDFLTSPLARRFVIEASPGGRAYEDWGMGRGRLWFTVVAVEPPAQLELAGHLFPAFGGPATSTVRLELSPNGPHTTLRLDDATFGRADRATKRSLQEGWTALLAVALKNYVEAPRS